MEKEKQKKIYDESRTFVKGMVFGAIILLSLETTSSFVLSKNLSDLKSGKKMTMSDFKKAEEEYNELRHVYNYYVSGGTSYDNLNEFTYEALLDEYYYVRSAAIKTYFQNSFDNNLKKYLNEGKSIKEYSLSDIYYETLWEIATTNSKLLNKDLAQKSLEEIFTNYYGTKGTEYLDYHNLKLTEEEEEAIEFIKK